MANLKSNPKRVLCALLLGFSCALLTAPAVAQGKGKSDAAAACGRKAKEEGLKGSGEVSAFVADCVAELKAGRHRGPDDGDKAKKKGSKDKKERKAKATKAKNIKKGKKK